MTLHTSCKSELSSASFGDDFIWGVSSSALQTEGAHDLHGKGLSIWDEFASREKIANRHSPKRANNFYHLYRNDIDILKILGIKNFRFSISWPRIIPDGSGHMNRLGVDYYHRVIDYCLESDIVPWITLYHWDLPHALEKKGGWTNREIVNWFSHYVDKVMDCYGDKVVNWMVLNEPLVFTGAGYFAGIHAPGKKGIRNFLAAVHHASLCQGIGYKLIKDRFPNSNVGTTFSATLVTPNSNRQTDVLATQRVDTLLNRVFIEPALGLGYPVKDLPVLERIYDYFKPGDSKLLKADFDFVGLQVYTREVIRNSWFFPYLRAKVVPANKRKVYQTQMGWEVYPSCIREMVERYESYSGVKKLLITENGASFKDELLDGRVNDVERLEYIQDHLKELWVTKTKSKKLAGYFVWSLTDNFEWAEGYEQRFGLVFVDFQTQRRYIKKSGYWYSRFLHK